MSEMRFLLDEDVSPSLRNAILREEPSIVVWRIGEGSAPPRGSLDPDNLMFAEANGFAIISRDKGTMPDHAREHLSQGKHTWGILRDGFPRSAFAGELILFWAASEAEDWRDCVEFIPW